MISDPDESKYSWIIDYRYLKFWKYKKFDEKYNYLSSDQEKVVTVNYHLRFKIYFIVWNYFSERLKFLYKKNSLQYSSLYFFEDFSLQIVRQEVPHLF